ncbi:MAG TPA: hypothetical protein VD913_04390, partial [bacterium]|nr:hypothetical protein [bacterium]
MLNAIADFVRRERKFTLLFVVVALIYTAFFVFDKSPEKKSETSPALQEFENAQKNWGENLKDAKFFEQYLKQKPVLSFWVHFFSLMAIVLIALGLMIDFMLIVRPSWRLRGQRDGLLSSIDWRISMLFKVIVLILAANIVLALFLG